MSSLFLFVALKLAASLGCFPHARWPYYHRVEIFWNFWLFFFFNRGEALTHRKLVHLAGNSCMITMSVSRCSRRTRQPLINICKICCCFFFSQSLSVEHGPLSSFPTHKVHIHLISVALIMTGRLFPSMYMFLCSCGFCFFHVRCFLGRVTRFTVFSSG